MTEYKNATKEVHGQTVTNEFLDQLFQSIREKIPYNQWVDIKKNHDQVVAGLKHMIDQDMYGAEFNVVFNSEFTKFKKIKNV